MKKVFFLFLLFAGTQVCSQQHYKSFIPKGFKELSFVKGDLNGDKIPDAILVLRDASDKIFPSEAKRPLFILFGTGGNKYKIAALNNNVVLSYVYGGGWGEPLSDIVIKNGYFSVELYGGSRERWSRIITFKYNKYDKKFYLHKDGSSVVDTLDPDKEFPEKIRTTKDFGRLPFEKFNVYN